MDSRLRISGITERERLPRHFVPRNDKAPDESGNYGGNDKSEEIKIYYG